MALESGTHVSDLVETNPTDTDLKSEGDDHLRLIKTCAIASLPVDFRNFTGTIPEGKICKINSSGQLEAYSPLASYMGIDSSNKLTWTSASVQTISFVASADISKYYIGLSSSQTQIDNLGLFTSSNPTRLTFSTTYSKLLFSYKLSFATSPRASWSIDFQAGIRVQVTQNGSLLFRCNNYAPSIIAPSNRDSAFSVAGHRIITGAMSIDDYLEVGVELLDYSGSNSYILESGIIVLQEIL